MAVEFKTLTFPNKAEGEAEKIKSLQWYSNQGWEVVSETITQGNFREGRAFCLSILICLSAAFCAGSTDGEITVTLKRDTSHNSSRDNAHITPVTSASNSSLPASSRKTYEPVVGIETGCTNQACVLFFEDGENYEAERYIEQALNQSPESLHVYMPKLTLLEDEKLFQCALRFADDEYKSQLQNLAQAEIT